MGTHPAVTEGRASAAAPSVGRGIRDLGRASASRCWYYGFLRSGSIQIRSSSFYLFYFSVLRSSSLIRSRSFFGGPSIRLPSSIAPDSKPMPTSRGSYDARFCLGALAPASGALGGRLERFLAPFFRCVVKSYAATSYAAA